MDFEIVEIEKINTLEFFIDKKGTDVDKMLADLEIRVRDFEADITTPQGRKEIISRAANVSKSKTLLTGAGKKLNDELKKQPKLIEASIRKIKDFCDNLRDDIRQPVTDFEQKEKDRIAKNEAFIENMIFIAVNDNGSGTGFTLDELKKRLAMIERTEIGEDLKEYEAKAFRTRNECLVKLSTWIEAQEKYETEQAELAKFKKEKEDRDRKEREKKIAKEAADKATADAEQKVRDAEAAKKKAEDDAKMAELDKVAAGKKAEQDKQDAIDKANREAVFDAEIKEQKRLDDEAEKKALADKKAANKRHQASVNNKALEDFLKLGFGNETSKKIVETIAKGFIRNVIINY